MKSKLAHLQAKAVAAIILEGFNKHYTLFHAASARAKPMFESANWLGIQQLVADRIQMYDERVHEAVDRLRYEVGANALSDDIWQQARQNKSIKIATEEAGDILVMPMMNGLPKPIYFICTFKSRELIHD